MHLKYLFLLPLGVVASPIELNDTRQQQNKEKLIKALSSFGESNFTWPELELTPVHHPDLNVDDILGAGEEGDVDIAAVFNQDLGLGYTDLGAILELFDEEEEDVDDPFTFALPRDHVVNNVPPEPIHCTPITETPVFILHHRANDDPNDPANDAYHRTTVGSSQSICSYFLHSVLGPDFGESTFPRVSYVNSAALPFRVHYAPDDNLRFESYKWPFAACNYACELQALKIRALFDWELDPVNENSRLDDETRQALTVAREICQWKNVHRYFAVDGIETNDLGKRDIPQQSFPTNLRNSSINRTIGAGFVFGRVSVPLLNGSDNAPAQINIQKGTTTELYLSDRAQSAIREIEGIFMLTNSPKDLAQMFHTVILACQIHRYTSVPMIELQISSTGEMIQQAMSQIRNLFAETQERIDVMEMRDAIVRAAQIYRYQEEQGR
jgi:hypothetical protein